jgi:hypothetical protein
MTDGTLPFSTSSMALPQQSHNDVQHLQQVLDTLTHDPQQARTSSLLCMFYSNAV